MLAIANEVLPCSSKHVPACSWFAIFYDTVRTVLVDRLLSRNETNVDEFLFFQLCLRDSEISNDPMGCVYVGPFVQSCSSPLTIFWGVSKTEPIQPSPKQQ